MRNTLKRVFAAVMAAAMLPVVQFSASAASEPELFLNESFDSYATYEQPESLDILARNWWIQEHAPKDKGLLLYASLQGSAYYAYAAGATNTVVSFDLKATDVMPTGSVNATDSQGRELTLMSFTEGRGAGAYNGLPLSGFGKARATNYTIVYRAEDKSCDIYVNGKSKVQNMRVKGASISDISKVTFTFASDKDAQGVIIDNVNIYASDVYVPMEYPRAQYNEDAYDEIVPKFGPQVGSNTIYNETFDAGITQLNDHINGNNFKIITDTTNPDNKVFIMERLGTGDSHLNAQGINSKSDYVVHEFDIRVYEEMSVCSFTFKDSNAKFSGAATLRAGYQLKANNGATKSLKPKQWYRISILNDYYNRKHNVYVDGELLASFGFAAGFMAPGATMDIFRIHMTHGVGGVTSSDPIKFEIDNVRVYESDKLIEGDLGQIVREIDVTTPGTIFTSDKPQRNLMSGYQGFHGTSGVCYVNNKKVLLNVPTYIKDDVAMMPAERLAEVFGFSCTVNGTKVMFNNTAIDGEIKDGIVYIPAPAAAKAFGKTVVNVPSTYNDNMYVMGSQPIQLPVEQSDIDALNDFLLYYRPDRNEFLKLYQESELAGVHPRIQFTQEDFDRMAALSETDYWMKIWKDRLLNTCENYLKSPLKVYQLYDGLRLGKQREMAKMIHALAVAYNLTKDQRYFDRAYAELENFAVNFPDWNPGHHLDVCECMAAYAVGYDWLYNYMTDEQRKVLEDGMYRNGFYDSWLAFQSTGSKMGSAYNATNNHGNVDNSGALMAAMAFIDAMPEVSAYIGANALRGAELTMYKWAPEGVWYEGAGYWELTMQFTAKWLDTLTTIWPQTAGLGMHNLEGMNKAALAELQSQTPLGVYNFADAMPQKVYVPEMLYLANAYELPGVYKACIDAIDGKWADDEDLGLAMMLYEPEMYESETPLELDYLLGRIDTVMMRNSWDVDEPSVVGIHGGHMESGHDQLDTGSFIYENGGVRWSMDMGMGEYNSKGYWDWGVGGERWKHYRSRAEAHSTIFTSPSEKEDHNVKNSGVLTVHTLKPRGGIASIDMTDTLYDVSSATRGFAFTDNRQSLVIRDELKLTKSTDVIWSMITEAECEIIEGENKAILSQKGKQLEVTWTSSVPVTAEYAIAQALPTSPEQTDNYVPGRYKYLRFTANTGGDFTLTVKLTPVDINGVPTTVADWDMPITSWSIPDGEIPPAPQIDTVTAGNQVLKAGTKTALEFSVVDGVQTAVPVISASSDVYDVKIEQAATLDDVARVVVTDKNDPYNRTVYTVKFTIIKAPLNFDGMTSIPVMGYEVSLISQEENPPIHMFDNDQSTRYAVAGVDEWAVLDLGSEQSFDNVMISFMSGHVRQQKLTISISNDNASWTEVWNGMSCGTTEDLETFKVPGSKARYIKLGLKGNTSGGENWNSLTSVYITKNN